MNERRTLEQRLLSELGAQKSAQVLSLLRREDSAIAAEDHWLAPVLNAAAHVPLHDVPDEVTAELDQLFPTRSNRLWVAELQLDSREQRQLAGVRGAGGADNWTMMFSSEPADVALGIKTVEVSPGASTDPTGKALRVTGQVLVHHGEQRRFRAHLTPVAPLPGDTSPDTTSHGPVSPGPTAIDAGDRFGRFTFDAVALSHHTLLVTDDTSEIVIDLDLSGPR